jgi:hypothetical protein
MSDDLVKRLDNLWSMLEDEGLDTKANTAILAKDRIEELEATLTDIISEYDEPDNGRSLRWAIDAGRELLKGQDDE